MLRSWRKFRALPARDRRLLLSALLLLPIVRLLLHTVDYQRTRRLLARVVGDRRAAADPVVEARRVGRVVNVASGRRALRATCLERSTLTWWLLLRRGIDAQLMFGVRRPAAEEITAHAWVEVGGEAVNDAHDIRERFSVLERNGVAY